VCAFGLDIVRPSHQDGSSRRRDVTQKHRKVGSKAMKTKGRDEHTRRSPQSLAPEPSTGVAPRVSAATLQVIERHFHALICARSAEFSVEPDVPLPSLANLLTQTAPKAWLPIDGMYGGFSYWIKGRGKNAKLMVESWSRVVGGSGKRHEITVEGSKLVGEGIDLAPTGTP